jgi:hypothetical protein
MSNTDGEMPQHEFQAWVKKSFRAVIESYNNLKNQSKAAVNSLKDLVDGLDLQITDMVRKTNAIHSSNDRITALERRNELFAGPGDLERQIRELNKRLLALEMTTPQQQTPRPAMAMTEDTQVALLSLSERIDTLEKRLGPVPLTLPPPAIAAASSTASSLVVKDIVGGVSITERKHKDDGEPIMTKAEREQMERVLQESIREQELAAVRAQMVADASKPKTSQSPRTKFTQQQQSQPPPESRDPYD